MWKTMKVILIIVITLIVFSIFAVVAILNHPAFGRKPSAERVQRMEHSPNYRDGMFHNEIPTPQFTGNVNMFEAMWRFLTDRRKDRVPSEPVQAVKTNLSDLSIDKDWLVWFGHSSYLFSIGGKRVLVDPVLKLEFPVSLMLHPFKGTDIYQPDDMPPIDILIITHEHWDHLDYATLRDLRTKVNNVVCPLGVAEYLEYWGYDKNMIYETEWGEVVVMGDNKDIKITCLPSRHFSNRLTKRNQTLWASFLVESNGRKVYIGGDGGYDHRFKRIKEQYGQVDLALMENGQYDKNWANIHLTPKDLEKAIIDLDAKQVFTVHHDKFALAKHAWSEPDSVAHEIAQKHNVALLDKPIGMIVYY